MRRLSILLTLLATSITITPQEKPSAVLVDEFERTGCEDISVRVSNFGLALRNNPRSKGYIVIYPKRGIPIRGYFNLEETMRGSMIFFRQEGDPITFVHAEPRSEQKVEFWIAAAGTQKPDFPEGVWKYALNKPKKIYDTDWPSGGVCPEAPVEELASILVENPTCRGHISITERSERKYRKLLGEIKTKLASVPASRLRFFRRRDCSGETCGRYQLWLIPRK